MKNNLPIMLLKESLILPNQEVKLNINNEMSANIIQLSIEKFHNELVVVSPKDQMEEVPEVSDLPNIVVVCKVKNKIDLPTGDLRVTLRGLFRANIKNLKNNHKGILMCTYKKLEMPEYKEIEALAIKKKLKEMITTYINKVSGVSNSILNAVKEVEDLNKLTDLIVAFLDISFLEKLEYIEEMNPVERGKKIIKKLKIELEIQAIEDELEEKIAHSLSENQKNFILKEKLRTIKEELGELEEKEKEVNAYYQKLNEENFPSKIAEKIKQEIKKFEYTNEASPELANIRTYLDWMFHLPWMTRSSEEEKNIKNIKKSLNKSHYGMENAKNKILEYIAALNRNTDIASPILCFIGPPGVGKTTLAKSIAEGLHKKFYKISVGGLNDSSVLNGHRRTYLGANPGKIIEALKKCGTNNPLILIDEIDKMVKDYKGNPASILLDILDKNQNKTFVDHYIEEEFDLSKVFFILTANNEENIPYELRDRLEIIHLTSYTAYEKTEIAKKYLLPIIFEEHKIESKEIKFNDFILKEIILNYTREAGVRELERVLTSIIRKLIIEEHIENVKITSELLKELLGEEKYSSQVLANYEQPGTVNAIGITSTGGIIIPIETVLYEGNGQIKITGHVEQIMKESIEVALSYLEAYRDYYNLLNSTFKKKDFHIHFLNAAIKKDGSSAGIAITTSLLSIMKKKKINSKYALTGEITLNGNIKKIGGLKEKLVGAINSNREVVIIPKENHSELIRIPEYIKENIQIMEVENYKEVYQILFEE